MGDVVGKVHETADGFEWRIDNFFRLTEKDSKWFSSPSFSNIGTSWRLRMESCIHPSCHLLGYIDLYLIKESYKSPVYTEFSLALRHVTGRKVFERQCTEVFEKGHDRHFSRQFASRQNLMDWKQELFPSGGITVVFSMKIMKPVVNGKVISELPPEVQKRKTDKSEATGSNEPTLSVLNENETTETKE